jgi:hypothetical protein
MDARGFDAFCKTVAVSGSRRRLLRGAAAGLLGAVIWSAGRATEGVQAGTSTLAPCGDAGLFCCNGNACNAGLVCQNAVCVFSSNAPCGDEYQACCSGDICNSGMICARGTCYGCGAQDELCCAGSVCNAGLTCATDTAICSA